MTWRDLKWGHKSAGLVRKLEEGILGAGQENRRDSEGEASGGQPTRRAKEMSRRNNHKKCHNARGSSQLFSYLFEMGVRASLLS